MLTGEAGLAFLAGLLLPALGFLRHCLLSPPSCGMSARTPRKSPCGCRLARPPIAAARASQRVASQGHSHTRCRLWTPFAQWQAQSTPKSQNILICVHHFFARRAIACCRFLSARASTTAGDATRRSRARSRRRVHAAMLASRSWKYSSCAVATRSRKTGFSG